MNNLPTIQKQTKPALPQPTLPAIPELFNRLQPVELPELTYDRAGFIRGWIDNRKKGHIAKSAQYEAEIAEYRERVTRATANSLLEALTFGERYQSAIKFEQYHRAMMDINRKMAEARCAQETYKAQLLGVEVEDANLTFKQKMKLFLKENPDANEDEAGTE